MSRNREAIILIMILGCICRMAGFWAVPGGINQDEAFAGYEAFSILKYGIDSAGYHNPVYLQVWGSGMSALNSYLMMPGIALFGLNMLTVRLPQVLVGCLSVPVFYLLMKRLTNERTAFWALLILSICPWHIMMCRWGLDCNLAPGFMLFGLYFFVLGWQKNAWFYLLSSLNFGLSLYGYAVVWLYVPPVIILMGLYLTYCGDMHISRQTMLSVLLLGLLALPLILFLLINLELLPPMLSPVLSIPRLIGFKGDDVSIHEIPERFRVMLHMLVQQHDDVLANSTSEFGLYYKGMLVFALIGFFYSVQDAVRSVRKKTADGAVIMLIGFVCALIIGVLVYPNVNRLNSIHFPILMLSAVGLSNTVERLSTDISWAPWGALGVLLAAHACFMVFYFTSYRQQIAESLHSGSVQAIQYASKCAGSAETVYVKDIKYSIILFATQISPTAYRESVQYTNWPDRFLEVDSFCNYRIGFNELGKRGVYVMWADEARERGIYEESENVHFFDHYAVLIKK